MWKVEYGRKYRETHREQERERCLRVKRAAGFKKVRDPEKEKARHAIRNAVAAGRIVKPAICSRCFSMSTLHAHHEDYAKPFDIQWLCSICHGLNHRAALAATEPKP